MSETIKTCHQCGKDFTTNEVGVTNHVDENDPHGINYDLDQEHTPYEL